MNVNKKGQNTASLPADPDALLAEAREAFPAAEIARLGALFAL